MAGRDLDQLGLVIFDCDGVLVDSEPLVNRIEAEYFTAIGFHTTPEEVRALFKGKTIQNVVDALQARLGKPIPATLAYDWGTSVALGLAQELRAIPGVQGVIERLQGAGIPMCVASQSPLPRVRLSLRVTGLDRYFGDNVFTAGMVANPKPAPDLFLFAAQRLGVAPERAIVIEDSPSGVLAARAAGMRVYGYAADEDAGALKSAGATIFHSMDELRFDSGLFQDPV